MAASGIAEHNEARRKEMGYLRRAWLNKEAEKFARNEAAARRMENGAPSSYDQQVQYMQYSGKTAHDSGSVDRQRRLAHERDRQIAYSAKIPNRYSSIDYISQW